jgi:hypothetical protein
MDAVMRGTAGRVEPAPDGIISSTLTAHGAARRRLQNPACSVRRMISSCSASDRSQK